MVDLNNNKTRAQELIERNRKLASRSESLMSKNMALSGIPEISNRMARSVSAERREIMEMQLEAGEFREQGSSGFSDSRGNRDEIKHVQTQMGVVTHSGKGLYKMATDVGSLSSSSGGGWRGSNDTVRQAPEVYSPLWLNSNLNLPRDRPTINAWSRSFFALNPIVHNAITLHSTYPIAKLNIKSKNPKVERFFSQMSEEIDLMNVAVMAAQEYWILGEAFIYGELDESKGSWSRLMILNPDYVNVQRSVIAAEPIISLRPDENLRRVVFGNQPSDLQQRKQLDPSIIEHVRRNEQIPLNNFYVHHMARRISPYEIRGTGLIVSCFRALMCFDKLRECYSTQHEVLTNEGFKRIEELVEISTDVTPKSEYVNGVEVDEAGNVTGVLKLKDGIKVACFNPETEELEYHVPEEFHMSKYTGKMLHFHGNKVDAQVTPNHKMWVRQQSTKKTGPRFGDWYKLPAKEMLDKKTWWKFRGQAKWTGKKLDTINVCGHEVAADIYLKFLGYVVSEGCVYRNNQNGRYDELVQLTQLVGGKYFDDIREVSEKFANCLDKNASDKRWVSGSGYSANTPKEKWETRIHGKNIVQYFFDEIGDGQSANSHNKHLPRWVMELCPEQLQILLDALNAGDGSIKISKHGTNSKGMSYSTVSKQLADDVYELVFKCGFAPNICVSKRIFEAENREVTEYKVLWSTTNYGNEPNVYTGKKQNHGNGGGASVDEIDYDGMVWCFTVPTGLFVTRCNNKISIQGNSKFSQADGMINPLTLVKIGNGEFRPSPVDLEHWRNVFECYDDETEVLTNDGFKYFKDTIDYIDNNGQITSKPKDGIKIGCFNPNTGNLEFNYPEKSYVNNYIGDMYHFHNDKIDIKVTPDHDMWVSEKEYYYNPRRFSWGAYHKKKAKDININDYNKFRSVLGWEGESVDSVEVNGHDIDIDTYLEFMGYVLSEGCCYTNNKSQNTVGISQKKYTNKMFSCLSKISQQLNVGFGSHTSKKGVWSGVLSGRKIYDHFVSQIGINGSTYSWEKRIPLWIRNLKPEKLEILLDAMLAGDGSYYKTSNGWRKVYHTSSKELANNVQEMVLKCGYSSLLGEKYDERDNRRLMYYVQWANSGNGDYPLVYKKSRNSQTKQWHNTFDIEKYNGKIWCFTVPTGLFVTRRNGKVTIQGNSASFDKDFKIFTHDAVNVERVGYGQGIYDTSADITQLIKEIYIGLMVPSVIMDGSDTTYATGSVALDVLRQRYMQFRQMMTTWLKRKIFAPIAQINDFYERVDGEKILIVPEIDWNHMSLFDMDSYINQMVNLTQGEGVAKRASLQTLYRSLGLEYEEEQRKIRYEDIQDAIRTRELQALAKYDLHELKALGPGDEIDEAADEPVPGESPYVTPQNTGALPGSPGGLGGGLGAPPGPGPMPGAPPPAPVGGGAKPPGL